MHLLPNNRLHFVRLIFGTSLASAAVFKRDDVAPTKSVQRSRVFDTAPPTTIPQGSSPTATHAILVVPTSNASPTKPATMDVMAANTTFPVTHQWPLSGSDFQSLSLELYQEHAEWNLFEYARNYFLPQDFAAAGLNQDEMDLIDYMAEQSKAHANLLTNILGKTAPQECVYDFQFTTVAGFLDLAQKLLRCGESGM